MEIQNQQIPFSTEQKKLLNDLLTGLNTDQKHWLGGYLTGINEHTNSLLQILRVFGQTPKNNSGSSKSTNSIKILYGTRTGNSLRASKVLGSHAESENIANTLISLNDYNPKDLKKEQCIAIVISTDGEGEPPIAAEEFYNYLMSAKAPKLENLKYTVLALGDSSYKNFCKVGRDIDERLKELGATAISERVDCDVEFEEKAKEWSINTISKIKESLPNQNKAAIHIGSSQDLSTKKSSRDNPANVQIGERILLNGQGSSKKTWHIELIAEDESQLAYLPGDAIGVHCKNHETLVDELLSVTGYKAETPVQIGEKEVSLRQSLIENYELSTLNVQVIENYAKLINNNNLNSLIQQKEELFKFTYGRDIIDLLQEFPGKLSPTEFTGVLRKIQPRLYSIASSHEANRGEIHLTVGELNYYTNNRLHRGACSGLLAEYPTDKPLQVYIDENISFRLPQDPSTPIIMIGAGTGIAPYRAFMQEKALQSNPGKSWLFFGDRNFTTDFLYQTEWLKLLKNNTLNRLDVAFSRDQTEKVYVQHKLIEHKKELFSWIEKGAHIYLCGDKEHMAHDVKLAIQHIIASETGYSDEKVTEYFKQLRKQGRFHEDVY